jgi:Flp pilus assembly protein TadG
MGSRTHRRRVRGDRGGAVLELALVVPLLSVLVLGLIEFGTVWRQDNVLIRSVQSAARTGATQGTDRFADYNALRSINASLANLQRAEIERVVIYKATTADGAVPAACKTAAVADDLAARGVADTCNIYSARQVAYTGNVLTAFGGLASCSASAWDRFWCPTERGRGTPTSDPDYLGMYVKLRYTPITGIVSSPETMETDVVYRLDPCITGVSCD